MDFHNKIINRPLLIDNITYNNTLNNTKDKLVLVVTTNDIIIFDLSLNLLYKFNLNSYPVLVKLKKKNLNLFIFDSENNFIKYNLKKISKQNLINLKYKFFFIYLKLVDFENDKKNNSSNIIAMDIDMENPFDLLIENIYISNYDISQDFIVFSLWNSNKIFVYSLKSKIVIELYNLNNEEVFVIGINLVKSNKNSKNIIISLSNGSFVLFHYLKNIQSKINFFSS